MATPIVSAAVPAPVVEATDGPRWKPDEGMTFSTVRVQQMRDAFLTVEHPADWSGDDLAAALSSRKGDVVASTSWWEASTQTTITEAVMGLDDPDDRHREPVKLRAPDLSQPEPVAIVTQFSEAE